jgi:predicted Zn finger-like uncharacterized protein
MEKPSLIVVCEHCAGQCRIQDFASPDTKSRVRCPHCSKVFVVNGDRGVGGGAGKSAKGSSDRLEAARNAIDDLLAPVPKPSRRKSSPPPAPKPSRRKYPATPPPSQRSPQQPVRAVPQLQGPRAAPSPEASPVASETTTERPASLLVSARQELQSGLEALGSWITAAAEMPVEAKAGAAALLLGLLVAVAYWLDGNPPEPTQQAVGITRPDAATTGLDPEASPRSRGPAGASQPRPAAPETGVAAVAPPPTAETAADVAPPPAKAAPTARPQTKTVKTPAPEPRPAPKAPAKAAATSGPGTTTPKPQPRSTGTVRSTAMTKPSAASTTRSPTRRPRTVTRTPVSQKTISSGSANSQQQGESGWVIEY